MNPILNEEGPYLSLKKSPSKLCDGLSSRPVRGRGVCRHKFSHQEVLSMTNDPFNIELYRKHMDFPPPHRPPPPPPPRSKRTDDFPNDPRREAPKWVRLEKRADKESELTSPKSKDIEINNWQTPCPPKLVADRKETVQLFQVEMPPKPPETLRSRPISSACLAVACVLAAFSKRS
jgi:hypothetical protein